MPPPAAVTSTVTVHELPDRIEPPVKVTVEPPEVAEGVPPQVLATFGVGAITTPVGNVSTSGAVRLATVASELLKVIVRVETPPAVIVSGVNDLPSVGGITVTGGLTVKVVTTRLRLFPLFVCNAPIGSVLV